MSIRCHFFVEVLLFSFASILGARLRVLMAWIHQPYVQGFFFCLPRFDSSTGPWKVYLSSDAQIGAQRPYFDKHDRCHRVACRCVWEFQHAEPSIVAQPLIDWCLPTMSLHGSINAIQTAGEILWTEYCVWFGKYLPEDILKENRTRITDLPASCLFGCCSPCRATKPSVATWQSLLAGVSFRYHNLRQKMSEKLDIA